MNTHTYQFISLKRNIKVHAQVFENNCSSFFHLHSKCKQSINETKISISIKHLTLITAFSNDIIKVLIAI